MRFTILPEKDSWFRRNSTLVLCLLTMLLLTLGITEQGATIERQRALIALLNRDSQQLMAMNAKDANEAQRKAADPQVAPDAKAMPDATPRQSAPAAAPKAQQPPKMEMAIDPREVRRVLLKS